MEGCGCGRLKPLSDLLLACIVTSVVGLATFVAFLYDVIRKGPKRMFCGRRRNVMPDILRKCDFGNHVFVRFPNSRMKLHCVVNGPTDKPLMLFLHGFPEFWYSWRHQLKEFSKDYRVVACDMRGYGESDKPCCISEYIMDKLVDDVDQLITELGYDRCVLVAHDWGGVVAWGYAAVHPERVERLIICNAPHPQVIASQFKTAFSQLRKSWYIFMFQLPVLPQLYLSSDDMAMLERSFAGRSMGARRGTFTPDIMEAYKYCFATYRDWSGPVNYYRAAIRYASPNVDEACSRGKIPVPTLIIWGTQDGALDIKLAELSSHRVEDCTVEYIEGASHWVQQEEPERVNTLIRQFLKKDL
jgi:pimeloyl-ACP methyl ester carboxylesterase